MSSLRTLLLATAAIVGGVALTPTESQARWYGNSGYYGGYNRGYGSYYRGYNRGYNPYYGGYRGYNRGGFYGNNFGYNQGRRGFSVYTPYGGFNYRSGRRW